jgi:hypothetical protein
MLSEHFVERGVEQGLEVAPQCRLDVRPVEERREGCR